MSKNKKIVTFWEFPPRPTKTLKELLKKGGYESIDQFIEEKLFGKVEDWESGGSEIRKKALQWWRSLDIRNTYKYMSLYYPGRSVTTLTGREIEIIYRSSGIEI